MFFSSLLKSSFRKRTAKIESFFWFAKVDDKLLEDSDHMTRYNISYDNPNKQFIRIEAQFEEILGNERMEIFLPTNNTALKLSNTEWRFHIFMHEQHFELNPRIYKQSVDVIFRSLESLRWPIAIGWRLLTTEYSKLPFDNYYSNSFQIWLLAPL